MRIIIVEDEQRARKGLKDMILSLSEEYEVIGESANGKKALELIRIMKPDVVFTDIKMPYMSGIELIRAARAQKLASNFIILSAYAEFDYARQAISLGAVEYLLKPLNANDVEGVLQRVKQSMELGTKYDWEKSNSLRDRYPDAHPLIKKVLDIMENSYAGRINQKDLAQSLGTSAEYLSYLFKKETNETFAHFLRNYRIEMAKMLYRNGECPVNEVPYAVGFSDYKYYCKVFREVTGMSINEFLHDR